MSENNSPSDETNQEPSNEPDEVEETEPNLLLLDDAMRERESLTEAPPPSDHGWLEQFEAFRGKAFDDLAAVAKQGLVEVESDMLLMLAVKLVQLAHVHDAEALSKFDKLWEVSH